MPIVAEKPPTKDLIREHYDLLSIFYRWLWGQHIHHGYWDGDESRHEAQEKLLYKLMEFAGVQPSAEVLDVGCGLGGTAIWLGQTFGARVTGITISPVQKHLATWGAQRAGISRLVQFNCLDASNMDSLSGPFDCILCIECSEHLADKAKFFRDCYRLARAGGRLAICAWCVGKQFDPAAHTNLLNEVLQSMLLPSLASAADYEEWARDAGFVSVEHRDVTSHVKATWEICDSIIRQPNITKLLGCTPLHVRDFAGSFRAMKEAFDVGAMSYVMLTGRRT
jgi:tocopherol O-methyltransferase